MVPTTSPCSTLNEMSFSANKAEAIQFADIIEFYCDIFVHDYYDVNPNPNPNPNPNANLNLNGNLNLRSATVGDTLLQKNLMVT